VVFLSCFLTIPFYFLPRTFLLVPVARGAALASVACG
jgi:hypothetical protein